MTTRHSYRRTSNDSADKTNQTTLPIQYVVKQMVCPLTLYDTMYDFMDFPTISVMIPYYVTILKLATFTHEH